MISRNRHCNSSYFYPPTQRAICLRRMGARPPSIRRLRAKEPSLRSRTTTKDEDYGRWKCVVGIHRSSATWNEGGYASAPTCQSTLCGGQGFRPTKNVEVPRASPVRLHYVERIVLSFVFNSLSPQIKMHGNKQYGKGAIPY